MAGHGVAEGLVVVEHPADVLVAKQCPLHEVAVGDRAALPDLVVRPALVAHDVFGFQVPVRLELMIHARSSSMLGRGMLARKLLTQRQMVRPRA
jgi:hypothetical protein